jgi:L,D-peptidoglycan transpeptidase YkuD (ErfK/YbiS/YcfS/YnhG family)
MKRDDELYEFGIVVRHNMNTVMNGKGSAIFVHVWRDSDQPTAGCTAMSKTNMLKVLRWLDPSKNPILIQVPEEVLRSNRLRIER